MSQGQTDFNLPFAASLLILSSHLNLGLPTCHLLPPKGETQYVMREAAYTDSKGPSAVRCTLGSVEHI
jgi:hypothetical protein